MISERMKQSVLIRINVIIIGIVVCMIIMLAFSNIKAIRLIHDKAEKTYRSMGEYYVNDLKTNLDSIEIYLLQVSETADYLNSAYSAESKESKNALAKQRLYNQLNNDILVYRPADYFFLYRKKEMMLVPSSLKNTKTPNWEMKNQLVRLINDDFEMKDQWKIAKIGNSQYLIKEFESEGMEIGCVVSIDRLITTIQAVNLSDYNVYFTKGDSAENGGERMLGDLSVRVPVSGTDSCVNIIIPKQKLYEEIRTFVRISIIFSAVLLVLVPVLCIAVYCWLDKPIGLIVSVMRKVDQEGMELRMPDMDNLGEYQIVSNAFNNMMEKLSRMKIEAYEKEKKEQKLYEQCVLLQINPHFFLNALNTICLLNKRKDSTHVQMMLTYLINYFKHVFSHQGDMVLLKDEVNFTLNYMAIQRQRYAERIHLRYHIASEAEDYEVPAMCILTFTENSIKYASDLSGELVISVTAGLKDGLLYIMIEDDGTGIPEDILDKLNRHEKIIRDDREHIGIQNIRDRFYIHYKDEAKLTISNRDSGGAVIYMELPAEKGRQDETFNC